MAKKMKKEKKEKKENVNDHIDDDEKVHRDRLVLIWCWRWEEWTEVTDDFVVEMRKMR